MSSRRAIWLAWTICAFSLVLTALSLFLLALNSTHPNIYVFDYWAENTMVAVVFTVVGAIITPRLPHHPIGWLFLIIGLLAGIRHLASQYATYTLLAAPGSLPGGEILAWISSWLWVPHISLYGFLTLLFPNGRLLSRHWLWVAWNNAILVLTGAILVAFSPGPIYGLELIRNPLGIEGMMNVADPVEILVYAFVFLAAVSLLVRLHRARGIEHQQLKWIAYTGAVMISGALLQDVVFEVVSIWWVWWAGFIFLMTGLASTPVVMGVAIMRYRLYHIDTIINRTLVYGSLTLMLGLIYLSSVVTLQYLSSLLTGQGNTVAIVASTLAIAALFNPLRRRIQSFIDRRFYRHKYDARKTLEAFGSRLRDETDLEKLCEDLGEVVDETMQPAHLSVILRSEVPSSTTKEQGQQEDQQPTRHEED